MLLSARKVTLALQRRRVRHGSVPMIVRVCKVLCPEVQKDEHLRGAVRPFRNRRRLF